MELADLSIKFGRRKLGYHRYSYADYGKGDRFGYGDHFVTAWSIWYNRN